MWRSRIEKCLLKYNPQKYVHMKSTGSLDEYLDELESDAEKIFSQLQNQLSRKNFLQPSSNFYSFAKLNRSICSQAKDITLDSIIYEIRRN